MFNDIYNEGYNNLKKLGSIIQVYLFHIIFIIIFIIVLFNITIKWMTAYKGDEYALRAKYEFLFKIIGLLTLGLIGSFINKLNKKKYEYFDTTVNTVVLQSSLWNFSQWTNLHKNWSVGSFNNTSWDEIITKIQTNQINKLVENNSNLLLLCDPLAKDINFSNIPEIKNSKPEVPNGYFVSFIRPDKVNTIDCTYNFENKTIAYIDISDYYFIQAIIQSYRMNPNTIKLQQLNSTDIQNIEFILTTTYIDMIITYIIPNSLVIEYIQKQRIGIIGFSTLDYTRVNLFYPYISPVKKSLKSIFATSSTSKVQILDKNNNTVLPQMTMKLLNIKTAISSSPSVKETFITRLNTDPIALDPNYRCYGNLIVENKAECDSIYDIRGELKDYPTVWDKPCSSNIECPFYNKNKTYPNKRGGCLENGYCEMPIGVLQSSPHNYYDTGRFIPFCYGCTPGNDPNCCEISQDYAFPNDTKERSANGLKTSISLM